MSVGHQLTHMMSCKSCHLLLLYSDLISVFYPGKISSILMYMFAVCVCYDSCHICCKVLAILNDLVFSDTLINYSDVRVTVLLR